MTCVRYSDGLGMLSHHNKRSGYNHHTLKPPASVLLPHSEVKQNPEAQKEPEKSKDEETNTENTRQVEKSAEPEEEVIFPEPIS
jgi:hypothetical protein